VPRPVMFSNRLERRRKVRRFAVLVALTVLAIGLALTAVVAIRGFDLLDVAEADRMPMVFAVLGALAGVLVLAVVSYVLVRAMSRVD
jgi:hypothetical protein